MTKYMFKCLTCDSVMVIETDLEDSMIHKAPPCPCGKARMVDMSTPQYAYSKYERIGLWD